MRLDDTILCLAKLIASKEIQPLRLFDSSLKQSIVIVLSTQVSTEHTSMFEACLDILLKITASLVPSYIVR